VIEAFVKLYKEGLIYRGYRMVNWDPASKSAISDEEVVFKEVKGKLWYFKYPVIDSSEFVVVATTRPETMLGDTGVAVNPEDGRYQHLIGKKVRLPLVGREIPIFSDDYVDMEFGTGVVKVTPAHDVNDYEMGVRHELKMINIFNDDATTNGNVPAPYRNLDRYDARKKVVSDLGEKGFLENVEDYTNNVGYSDRGGVPIEPYLSEQWFMKMDELVEPALEVVRSGKIKFHPNHWIKTYEHWMDNIKDWCISRQLWWGHRIPVWYHKETGEIYCEADPPADIENYEQDKDVLDTWASSWLWAQDVFTSERDQKYYYPTDLLVTAPDIIFFWVARMIIAGQKFMGDIPFKDVYFTSIIRDIKGRKMSKSLGNSPDPVEVISEYGADALRFTINYISPIGQDVLFSTDKCELGRNFANKIWNAARYLLMNAEGLELKDELKDEHIDFTDKWIMSRFQTAVKDFEDALDKLDVYGAAKILYNFIWSDYCDWYLELSKERMYSNKKDIKGAVLYRSILLFEETMKLLHPFMPFISEEIWHMLGERKAGASVSVSQFPVYDESLVDKEAEDEIEFVRGVITGIRNIRGEMNIPPSKKLKVMLKTNSVSKHQEKYIKNLAKVSKLVVKDNLVKPEASASAVVKDCDIFIPLEGLIDINVERNRLQKEISRLEGLLKGVAVKLSNEDFVSKAPEDVVTREKAKQKDWTESLEKFKALLNQLK
jgi:valyl-tRNA synthetase